MERRHMKSRLMTLAVTGLLLLTGFTAAAIAGAGSPLDLLTSPAKSPGASHRGKPTSAPEQSSARSRKAEEADRDSDDERAEAEENHPRSSSKQKVLICHHTGSWKHPFHPIAVDGHAVPAHTGHGDTVGSCPSLSTSGRAGKNGKPSRPQHPVGPHARGSERRRGRDHGRGEGHKPQARSAAKNRHHRG
jgi:hypothetical protein